MYTINLFPKELAILWENNQTTVVSYVTLRKACPCAVCRGEKDALGNRFGGTLIKPDKNIAILKYQFVGHYGIQFFWSDGHKDGIYTFKFLKALSYNEDS